MRANTHKVFILVLVLILFAVILFTSTIRAKKINFYNNSIDNKVNSQIEKEIILNKNEPQIADDFFTTENISAQKNEVMVLDIIEDSRCPENVQCVWEGTVRVKAIAVIDGKAKELDMNLGIPYKFNNKTITMIQAGAKGAYDFKFKIE